MPQGIDDQRRAIQYRALLAAGRRHDQPTKTSSERGVGSLVLAFDTTQGRATQGWHPLQEPTTGLFWFTPGYDAPGDPCHPIFDPDA